MYHMYYMYHVGVKKAKLAKANVWLYLFGVITAVAPLPWSHWAVTFFLSRWMLDLRACATFSPNCEDSEVPRRS